MLNCNYLNWSKVVWYHCEYKEFQETCTYRIQFLYVHQHPDTWQHKHVYEYGFVFPSTQDIGLATVEAGETLC